MFARLKTLLSNPKPEAGGGGNEDALHLAAAALLVEAAHMDGKMDEDEIRTIEALLQNRFDLTAAEARILLEEGQKVIEETGELYRFTRTLKDAFSHEDRVRMLEMLWEVAFADGTVDHFESNLIRRIAGLLYVSDPESGAARKRVVARRNGA